MTAPPPERLEGYLLAPQQRRLWRWIETTGAAAFRTVWRVRLRGAVDVAQIERACTRVAERHEILRSRFEPAAGLELPLQIVLPAARFVLTHVATPDALEQRSSAALGETYDPAQEPALKAELVLAGDDEAVLVVHTSAFAADAGSAAIWLAELTAELASEAEGSPREPVAFSYARIAEWSTQRSTEPEVAAARERWRQREPHTAPGLPLSHRAVGPYRPELRAIALAPELGFELRRCARRLAAEPADLVLAVWSLWLARLSGERAPLVGCICDGRLWAELDAVPGLFARTLPLAAPLELERPFAELVGAVAAERAAATSDLEGWLPDDPPGRPPASPSAGFDYLELPAPCRVGALELTLETVSTTLERHQLTLVARLSGERLELALAYDPAALARELPLAWARSLAALLESALRAPERTAESLELLSASERAELVAAAVGDPLVAARPHGWHRRWLELAHQSPDAVASERGGEHLSRGALAALAAALVHRLAARGMGPGSLVALLLEPSAELVAALVATLGRGAAYLPLDPLYPTARCAAMLADAGAALILTSAALEPRLPADGPPGLLVDGHALLTEPAGAPPVSRAEDADDVEPASLAYVMYTSGSTGRPKGVMVSHGALDAYLDHAQHGYALAAGRGVPVHSSVAFDLSVTSLLAPLLAGAVVRFGPSPASGVETLAELARRHGELGLIKLTPGHARVLARQLEPARLAHLTPMLVLGGEPLLPEDVAFWRRAAPRTRLINEYGPTEAAVGCATYEPGTSTWESAGSVPIGRPIAGAELHVLDRRLEPLPVAAAGQLWIAGAGLARGYLGRPGVSAERFVPHPFADTPGARLYATGDLARRLPDHRLELLGRVDRQVKVRGYRVELGEIEAQLRRHPQIAEAVVAVRAEPGGAERLVAWLGLEKDAPAPRPGELRRALATFLPEPMLPSAFVVLAALPLDAHGKLDRGALPAPEHVGEQGRTPPRTIEEEVLAAIWSQVLGVQEIGVDDDYFALGGDSIRAIPVVSLAHEKGLHFRLEDVFRERTVRRLAGRLSAERDPEPAVPSAPFVLLREADRALLPAGLEDAYPLGMLQAGMIFHRESEPEAAVYHDVFSYRLRGRVDPALVERAIAAAIARHPVLRATFDLARYAEPVQLIHREGPTPFEVFDLRQLSPERQAEVPAAFIEQEKRRGWDLGRLPLIRFALHVWNEEVFQFTISIFHPIIDGWSDATLLTEIALGYAALERGEQPPFEPPRSRHRDAVALERAALADPETRAFWHRLLAGAEVLELPRLRAPRAASEGHHPAVWHTVPISEPQSDALKRLARRAAVPIKNVLQAVHLRALAYIGGRADVLSCATASGRPETPDGERVLGLFLNSMPLRVVLGGGSWLELIAAAFELERRSLPHRRFPMGELAKRFGHGTGGRLSETSFYFTHYHVFRELERLPELALLGRTFHEATSFPLVVNFSIDAFSGRVGLELTVDPNLFTDEQVAAWRRVFARTLEAMLADPEGRYETLSMLDPGERRQLLATASAPEPPAPQPLLAAFLDHAEHHPETTAVVAGERVWSYLELRRRAETLAARLGAHGVGAESVVALALERSPELVAAVVGVLLAGAAYLPLDPRWPARRCERVLADAGARVVLRRGDDGELVCAPLAPAAPAIAAGGEDPAQLAYVLYTSGSTGQPKGVMVSRGALAAYLEAAIHAYGGDGAGTLLHSSAAFDLTVTSVFVPLALGQRLVIVPEGEGVSALAHAFEQAADLSFLKLTPAHARLLGPGLDPAGLAGRCRRLILGGEQLLGEDLAVFTRHAPATVIDNEYGPTEAVVGCARFELAAGALASGPVPIGRPLGAARLHLLDGWLEPVLPGVAAELWIGGEGLARGYLGRPGQTAERFVPDPFAELEGRAGARLYRSGDLARRRPDGVLEFLGRRDRQLKIRGHRIEPEEVRAALLAHPAVLDAAVLNSAVLSDSALGHGPTSEPRLIAWIVARGELPAVEPLRAFLAETLPEPMIPAVFLAVPALPLTPQGKLDLAALPGPDTARPELATRWAAPRDEREEILAGVFARALQLERVGIDDDYFALGGDSIRSLQVVALAREQGLDLSLDQLFERRTIRALAAAAATAEPAALAPSTPFVLLTAAQRAHLPAGLEDAYPLSRLQEGMLYHRRREPGSALYHDVMRSRLRARLDLGAARAVLAALLTRHPVLRTSFALDDGEEPCQHVHRAGVLDLAVLDLRRLRPAERERALAAWVASEQRRGFSPARLPLIRFVLHRLDAEVLELAISFHHAILDGWSDAVMHTELGRDYAALLAGQSPPSQPPSTRYRDFIALEHAALADAAARDFWRRELDGSRFAELPWERRAARGAHTVRHVLARPLALALERLARTLAVPLKSVLLAAHLRIAARLGASPDVVTALVTSGRPETADGQRVFGLFLNSLPLRARLAAGSWEQLVRTAFETERRALPHRRFPLAEIQRLHGGGTLAETAFYFTHYHVFRELDDARELAVLGHAAHEQTSFPLVANFHLDVLADELSFQLTAARARLDAAELAALAGEYLRSLESMVAEPRAPWPEAALLRRAERHQLLQELDDTAWEHSRPRRLERWLAAALAARPEAVAVQAEAGALSAAELWRRALTLAGALRRAGVGTDAVVGIFLERGLELSVALLGVLAAGAAYLPLEPEHPPARLRQLADDALGAQPAPRVLTTAALAPRLETLLAGSTIGIVVIEDALGSPAAATLTAPEPSPEAAAYVIYTSGSTGRPKGVVTSHRAIVNRLAWMAERYALGADDRVLQKTPLGFDVSVWELFLPLLTGSTLVYARPGGQRELGYLARLLEHERITTVHFVPSVLQLFVDALAPGGCPALRRVIASGEALPAELARRWGAGFTAELHNLYGPTEAAVDVSAHACRRDEPGPRVPIGRAIAGVRLHVLDAALAPVRLGELGELVIGGVALARGYLGRPGLTARVFVPDPLAHELAGARLYRTGDLARRLASGAIDFLGRRDGQVKIRGVRIELGEVESALAALPGVAEAAVLTAELGPGELGLVAWVATGAEARSDVETWRAALAAELPAALVPAAIGVLAELPRTGSGKLDRQALAQKPLPTTGATPAARPPSTPLEELLAIAWAQLLGRERVGVEEDFFALGGHSLLAMRLAARLRKTLGLEVPIEEIFAAPTPARLAERLSAAAPALPPIPPADRSAALPLSEAQERLWFLDRLVGPNPFYNVPAAIDLEGALDTGVLDGALTALVARHESLRASFPSHLGIPRLAIAPITALALPRVDLEALAPADRVRALEELTRETTRRCFELERGPLVRVLLLRAAARAHRLVLAFHHAVCDGWSLGILLRDLAELYHAGYERRPARRPAAPLPWADWAAHERHERTTTALGRELDFWRRRLDGMPGVLELPTDHQRPPRPSFRGRRTELRLSPAVSTALVRLAEQRGTTPFAVVASAFAALVYRLSGSRDFGLGTPVARRERAELHELVGLLVDELVARIEVAGEPSFGALLEHTRARLLEALAHAALPFSRLVEAFAPEGDLARNPLFQIAVVQSPELPRVELPELRSNPFAPALATAKLDLTLYLSAAGGGFELAFEAAAELFDATTPRRWLATLERLLGAALAAPATPLAQLALLGAGERQQLLAEWALGPPLGGAERPPTVVEQILAHAERTPRAPALCDGAITLDYAELDRRSAALAAELRRLGVGPETRVALCHERSVEAIVVLLAILRAGGAYVPLDPHQPRTRLEQVLADAEVAVLADAEGLHTRRVLPPNPREALPAPEHLAYVVYTSGSTGRPKGVAVEHGALALSTQARLAAYDRPAPCALLVPPLFFDSSVAVVFGTLCAGGQLVLPPAGAERDPEQLAALIARHRIDTWLSVPSLYAALLEHGGSGLGALGTVIVAGESCPAELVAAHHQRLREVAFIDEYGPTEGTVWCSVWRASAGWSGGTVPIGRPIAGRRLDVLDGHGRPAPLGVTGELWLAEGLARGYEGDARRTAERFRPDPHAERPGERRYATGDLARWRPSGELELLGRRDHQVKLRGVRIELGEIEACLGAHPAVAEAVAALCTVAAERRLVAWVKPRTGLALTPQALREHAATQLPAAFVPSFFELVTELPRTPTGKLDRRALPTPRLTATATDTGTGGEHEAPQGAVEEQLAAIWRAVLGCPRVSRHDSFFALGGDSILSLQVVARAREAGLALSPQQVFEHPTLAAQAAAAGLASAASPLALGGEIPLLPAQLRFFAAAGPDLHHDNQSLLFALGQPLAAPLLDAAARVLAQTHEALRVRFEPVNAPLPGEPGWRQVIGAAAEGSACHLDLGRLTDAHLERAQTAVCDALQRSLALIHGPLWRLALIERGAGRGQRLAWICHHLIIDGVSWRVLVDDLERLLSAGLAGAPLPALTGGGGLQRWAEHLQGLAALGTLGAELPLWETLASEPTGELPIDHTSGPADAASAEVVRITLDRESTRRLFERPGAARGELNALLVSALAAPLLRWSGAEALRLELEGHGREPIAGLGETPDAARTVGWLTAIHPLVVRASSQGTLLETTRVALERLPHHGAGYGILRWQNPDPAQRARLAAQPPAQVVFNYLGQTDRGRAAAGLLYAVDEPAGRARSPRTALGHLLAVNAAARGGELHLSWVYSRHRHRRATIEALAAEHLAELRALAGTADENASEAISAPTDIQRTVLERYDAATGIYHCQDHYRLHDADFSLAALRAAFAALAHEQAALRASLRETAEGPRLVVQHELELPITCEDLGAPSRHESTGGDRVDRWLEADRERGFDAPGGLLWRCHVIERSGAEVDLCWSMHHAVIDGWSHGVLLARLLELYRSARAGEPLPRARAADVQPQLIALEQHSLGSAETERFWDERWPRPPHRRPTLTGNGTAEMTATLPAALDGGLAELQRRLGVSARAVFLGAFLELLAPWYDDGQAAVGLVTSLRSGLSEPFSGVGLCWSLLAFAAPATGAPAERLRAVEKRLLELEPHAAYPQRRLRERHGGEEPFFASFNFVHFHHTRDLLAPATGPRLVEARSWDRLHPPLGATVAISPRDGSTRLHLQGRGNELGPAALEQMLTEWLATLERWVAAG